MERFKNILRTEADVEIYSCTCDILMIFIYGLLLWIQGKDAVSFGILLVMMLLGYAAAWTQQALFFKEKAYGRGEYRLRTIGWFVLPMTEIFLTGRLFHWYDMTAKWTEAAFNLSMLFYFAALWLFMKWLYEGDTKELNGMLQRMKDRI